MVTDLEQLMRDTVSSPPDDTLDLGALLEGGRGRVRRRRTTRVGVVSAAAVAVVAVLVGVGVVGPDDRDPVEEPAGLPVPAGPMLHLDEAERAVEGRDYVEVFTRAFPDYPTASGESIAGMTDDGLLVVEQFPGKQQDRPFLTLVDPGTGTRDPLPNPEVVDPLTSPRAFELGADRLVYWSSYRDAIGDEVRAVAPAAQVFDRTSRQWTTVTWQGLPPLTDGGGAVLGPDDRLYVRTNPSDAVAGDFGDESGAGGVSHDLWSVSLTDPTDVRDEGLRVGQVDFTSAAMVWTDGDNGAGGLVHVRDLASGAERSFDPRSGERCNLLGLGAGEDAVVLSQYCGTDADGVRDDRVQVLTTSGEPVVTIQGDGIDGGIAQYGPGDVVAISAVGTADDGLEGSYAFDLETRRLLRFSEGGSVWAVGGGTPSGHLMWSTPLGEGEGLDVRGLTQHVARLLR